MKKVGSKRYLHRTALAELPAKDRKRVQSVSAKVPGFRWSIVRLDGPQIMLGRTTSFDTDPHPALLESITFKSGRQTARRKYGSNPPIYHRIELMLPQGHPARPKAASRTKRQQAKGLLSRPDIGTRSSWKRAKGSHNMQIKAPTVTYYASGTNSPAYMAGFLQEGHPIGISLEDCKGKCLDWIMDNAANPNLRLFVDSGAYNEFSTKKQIPASVWRERLKTMEKIGKAMGKRALIVLPDKIGDADESYLRILTHAPAVQRIIRTGAKTIVPLQLGMPPDVYMEMIAAILKIDPSRFVLGLPMRKSPLSTRQVGKLVHDLNPVQVHLLGLGPEGRRYPETIKAIQSHSPGTKISADSVFVRRVAGKARGGQLTRRRYEALFDVGFGQQDSLMPDLDEMYFEPQIWIDAVTNPRMSERNRRKKAEQILVKQFQGTVSTKQAKKAAKGYLDGQHTLLGWLDEDQEDLSALMGRSLEGVAIRQSKRGTIGPGAGALRSAQVSRIAVRRTLSGQVGGMDRELNEAMAAGQIITPKRGPWTMARLDAELGPEITRRIRGITPYGAGQAIRGVLFNEQWNREMGTWGSRGKPVSATKLLGYAIGLARQQGSEVNDPEWLPSYLEVI